MEALLQEIKSCVVEDDNPDAADRAKRRGLQQAAAAKRRVTFEQHAKCFSPAHLRIAKHNTRACVHVRQHTC